MILILGDIHSDFKFLKSMISEQDLRGYTIIQVGDFGIGFDPINDDNHLINLNKFLSEWDCMLYAIRGNHDDPHFFEGYHVYSNLNLLKDYSQLQIDGYNFLFVGGATSIDRLSLIKQMKLSKSFGSHYPTYWKNESFIYDESEIDKLNNIDIVISHTAPDWCYPEISKGFGSFVEYFMSQDEKLSDDLKKERLEMNFLFNRLKSNGNKVKLHFYGHFHDNHQTKHDGIVHQLLDIKEIRELDWYVKDLLS